MSHRCRVVLVAFLFLFSARFAGAQCPTPKSIPNFRSVSFSPTSFSFAWDAPAGAPANAVYEIVREVDTSYCAYDSTKYFVVDSTTATSYTAALTPANSAFAFFVQLKSDPCTSTDFYFAVDSFTTLPAKPATPSGVGGASSATITFSYSDTHAFNVNISRAIAGGQYSFVKSIGACTSNPKQFVDSNLAPGTYQYRLGVSNVGTGSQSVFSDPVTVIIGSTPIVNSFSVAPSTIRTGQQATLSWQTSNASSVLIDQGVGTQPLSGTVTVSPSFTTTYTLSAMSGAQTTTASVTVNVITTPSVVVSSLPSAIVQAQGTGGATTSYTLSNAGGASTSVFLEQDKNFFTQTPIQFALAPGQSQVVTVTGVAQQAAGVIEGAALPFGTGVAQGLQIPIKLLSTALPSQPVSALPGNNRVDVADVAGASPTGSVSFTNNGNGTLTGVLVSDAPWIIPQSDVVSIPPHTTSTFTFRIDRTKRPDSDSLLGSLAGNISLVFLSGGAAKTAPRPNDATPAPSVSTVVVVDTVKLTVSNGAPPALTAGEVALFIPGVGHVNSTVGVFISDVAFLNPTSNRRVDDLRLFFTPVSSGTASAKTAAVPSLGTSVSVAIADVVKNVFGNEGQVGSLQIRSRDADKLGLNTNIFNSSSPSGTYGTAIPTFRSDRSVAPGDRLVLSGLRQDANSHTNLFYQETSGGTTSILTEFFDANGLSLGTRSDTVGPFVLAQVNNVVPNGAVAAIMTSADSSPGRFLAFATPVDNLSGDNWSVVDWSRQFGYSQSDPIVIPVAGVLRGANNTFFRTDVAIMNTGTATASGTLRFVSSAGTTSDRQVTLGAHQSDNIADVIGTLFGLSSTSGYLLFTPAAGAFAITSRTYATVGSNPATYGTAVPAMATSAALKLGSLRAIAALEDSAVATVIAARPATFRTNFGMVETSGKSVTVRVTIRFTFPAGSKVQGAATASKDYNLAPSQFIQINGLTADVLGSARTTFGDLHGVEADFQVVSGDGAVTIFTSSTDNGTGDSILRTE
jgi:hypothetical protein